jgi:hypothetical protein
MTLRFVFGSLRCLNADLRGSVANSFRNFERGSALLMVGAKKTRSLSHLPIWGA